MFGPDLLVAPVLSADGVVDYYVPSGRWVSLLTGEAVEGPGWRRETHGYDTLPLLVRPGAVVPVGSHDDRPDYDYLDGLTLLTNRPGTGVAVRVPDLFGATAATFTVAEGGRVDGPGTGWRHAELGPAELP
jgi:alpha-D-xyloside xylohydrolase